MDDAVLARRSILGFGEMVAVLGGCGVGPAAVIRRPDAIGARITAAGDNPWFDAVVVPPEAVPPADDPGLPMCVWTVADSVPGRVPGEALVMPVMGVELANLTLDDGGVAVVEPAFADIGAMNERAYGMVGAGYAPLFTRLDDARLRRHGLCVDGVLACVAVTLAIEDDIAIHYVATEAAYRRQGLASRLLLAVLAAARARGVRTATLQASADGLPVYRALGFRELATLRGFVREQVMNV